MTTPADEMRQAVEILRAVQAHRQDGTPLPAHITDQQWDRAAEMHPTIRPALAQWLESTAAALTASTHPGWQEHVAPHALAVARALTTRPA